LEIWFETGINNWAHTDVTCGHLIKPLLLKQIIDINAFDLWRKAKNKYQRRAVPVSLIGILKTTSDFKPLFRFIEPLMRDPERVVHQGVGWFLREAWKLNKPDTEAFLLKWKNDSPRLIFQYACEKMNAEEKLRFKRDKDQK
jgi:3-methyladenine DNA glycosylase AlkD